MSLKKAYMKTQLMMATRIFSTLLGVFFLSAGSLFGQSMRIGDPTKNNGKVEWTPMQIETGDVPYGVPVERSYTVRNIGTEPLILLDVKTGCHCTVADWTKTPIEPGQSGTITVTYDALKEGQFYKVIAVNTNFDPEVGLGLSMVGNVLPKPKEE